MLEVKPTSQPTGNFLEAQLPVSIDPAALPPGCPTYAFDLLDGQEVEEVCDKMLDWLGQFHPERLRRLCEEIR